jgi:glycosyltransferase involved in cell wall biosynthesis
LPAERRKGRSTLRIGLNLLFLGSKEGGTKTYALGLLHGLGCVDSSNEYFVFLSKDGANLPLPEKANFHRVVCGVDASVRELRYLWEQTALPVKVARLGLNVLHSLGYVSPLFCPCHSVVTVHDANAVRIGASMELRRRLALRLFSRLSTIMSDRVITVSNFSRSELIGAMGVRESKISMIYSGPGRPGLDAVPTCAQPSAARPFVLAFDGSPHKNTEKLALAFEESSFGLPHELLIAGSKPKTFPGSASGRVRFLGRLSDSELWPLLREAALLVQPSLYEGFGFPVVEAQRVGIPVACSNRGALHEVGGDACFYFDPTSRAAIGQAIRRCLEDNQLRSELREKGFENAKRFCWERTAREVVSVYRQVSEMAELHA